MTAKRAVHVAEEGRKKTWCGIPRTALFCRPEIMFYVYARAGYRSAHNDYFCGNCKRARVWKQLLAARGLS